MFTVEHSAAATEFHATKRSTSNICVEQMRKAPSRSATLQYAPGARLSATAKIQSLRTGPMPIDRHTNSAAIEIILWMHSKSGTDHSQERNVWRAWRHYNSTISDTCGRPLVILHNIYIIYLVHINDTGMSFLWLYIFMWASCETECLCTADTHTEY